MPNWRDGLVEAFPVPEDRRKGYKKKKKSAVQDGAEDASTDVGEAFSNLAISTIPSTPFPFFDLPSELRNRIYNLILFSKPEYRSAKGARRGSRLTCLLVSKKMHDEASYMLYTTQRFKIFMVQQFDMPPLIEELPAHYQKLVTNLEMVVGSSWTAPPKSWKVTKTLARCLRKLPNVQTLRVFVDFDPSHPAFARYRVSYAFYTDFCGDLLGDVLEAMPRLKYVELDGNPGVDVDGPLVRRLREEAKETGKEIRWGSQAGWAHKYSQCTDWVHERVKYIG